jgi:hypothetical protein
MALLLTPCRMPAQSAGSARITGTITDPSGAVVPGAHVKATQTSTGLVRETVTSKLTNALLGDWQLSPIVSVRTGFPFGPAAGRDNSRSGVGADRPNLVGDPYVKNLNTRQWLNPAAFVANPVGTFGNAGWNSLRAPGYFNIEVGLSRYFSIRESQRLQLRFEFFNDQPHELQQPREQHPGVELRNDSERGRSANPAVRGEVHVLNVRGAAGGRRVPAGVHRPAGAPPARP